MITVLSATLCGLLIGLGLAGPLGAALGIVLGFALGMLLAGSRDAALPIPADTPLCREQQHILCETKGRVATAGFLRDGNSGQWLDVEHCSLCDPHDRVRCGKRCLVLIRGVLPGRSHPVPH